MKKTKLIIGITIIVAAIGLLVMKGLDRSMMAYVEVQQLLNEPDVNPERAMQVIGIVQPGSMQTTNGGQNLTFTLQDLKNPQATIPVYYTGIIPDNFKPGLQVVVQGNAAKNKTGITAERLLVKCPSKYEATVEDKKS